MQFLEWFTSSEVQKDFAREDGSAAVTGSALTDPEAAGKYRWLPAIKDAVNNSVPKPKTPDEPKFEDILGTAPERGARRGDPAEERLHADRPEGA